MSQLNSQPIAQPISQPPRGALIVILVTAFLNLAGIGLLGPVSPFLVDRYVPNPAPGELALVNGLLFTAYSLFQFLLVPVLGALSDRFGRRPVLLVCLAGSAIGYFLFGIGGALWVLFLGRIIDGATGGNIGVIYAYTADITDPRERTRYYGLLGAVSGFGFIVGPALGAVLSRAFNDPAAPAIFAGIVTTANVVLAFFLMPESLPAERRSTEINAAKLNPFVQLIDIFRLPQLRLLLLAVFFQVVPFAALQSNLSVLGKDFAGATADEVSIIFTIIGVIGVVVQGGLIRPLTRRFGEVRLATAGTLLQVVAFGLIALVPVIRSEWWVAFGAGVFAIGNSLFIPTSSSLLSQLVSPREQGRVQGGSQSVQAAARVVGPLYASAIYGIYGGAPYVVGAFMFALAASLIVRATPTIMQARASRSDDGGIGRAAAPAGSGAGS